MIILELDEGIYLVYLLNKYPYIIQKDNNIWLATTKENIMAPEFYLKNGAILIEYADISRTLKTTITSLLSVLSEQFIQRYETEKK